MQEISTLTLLSYNEYAPTQKFVDSLFSHMFLPLINKSTRITAHSATLIDNIFTNNISDKVFNAILINDMSDHLPILSYLFDDSIAIKNRPYKVTRNFNESNTNLFRSCLSETDWSEVLTEQDPNEAYNKFHAKYSELYDLCFPMEQTSDKYRKNLLSPWITKSLLISIKKKEKII